MSIRNTPVTVLGAGIAGLAVATALAQRGARVTVLEQAAALGEVGAGLQISPNGVAVLEALGLRKRAEVLANVPEAVSLRDMYSGDEVARLPMGAHAVARWKRPYWQFHRADLLGLLAMGAREAGVDIRLGQRIGGIDDIDGLVVAADGVRSGVRTAYFGGQQAVFTGQVAWRGLIPAAAIPGRIANAATVYMGAGRHLVTYPLRGGSMVNFVAVEERDDWQDEGWNLPDSADNLRAAFAGAGPDVTGLLKRVEETFLWGLFSHPVLPHWSTDTPKGKVVLVGDACHPMLPFLAQGAVMALEDAWVLARNLDERGIAAGVQAYEEQCKPRATKVQRAAAGNARAYHLRPGVARRVAHTGLSALSRTAPDLLLGKFDWLYGADVTRDN